MTQSPKNRVSELMTAKRVSLRDIAVALNVSEDTARRLDRTIPSKYIPALVALFDCTSDHLLGLDRQSPKGQTKAAA